jgi:glutamate synthase domain-containing protein 2
MPVEYAIPKVLQFLKAEGIRDQVTLVASGGIRSAYDLAKAIALGADAVQIGTADLVALECLRCHNCESGRGCARGIATTDPELVDLMTIDWGTDRRLGLRSIRELVGRTDVLAHLDYFDRPVDDDLRR